MNINILSAFLLKRLNISFAIGLVMVSMTSLSLSLFASVTSNFTQTINAGSLSVDIVDGSYVPVGAPSVIMSTKPFSFSCQNAGNSSTGTFGTATQQIYVKNPDAADNGWAISFAASSPTAVWDGAASDYDFNDPTGSGCTDGGDTDALAGQLTVDTSTVSNPGGAGDDLTKGTCLSCTETGLSIGTTSSFNEGTTDSITLLSGAAGSDDIGDWTVRNFTLKQTIPAEQAAASDYDLNMTVTIATV